MAQKVTGYIKLQIPAAKATASPPVGPALGQHGVNISQFIKEFNERTKDQVKEIAERKMPDLTANTIEAAMSQVAGTCRSMGIVVVD